MRASVRYLSTSRTLFNAKATGENTPKITTFINQNNKESIKIEPIKRTNEKIEAKRARLVYQSRKRGILETDLLLSRFSKKYLAGFTLEELNEYDRLLDQLDWDIYYWATKKYDITPLPKEWENSKILKMLQEFSENKEREVMRMPNLFEDKLDS